MRGKPGLPDAWSEHAWGNAWDIYHRKIEHADGSVSWDHTYTDKVRDWLKAEQRAGRLPVASIIEYGANGTHIHITGMPRQNPRPYTSVPPCAGSQTDPEDQQMIEDIQTNLNAGNFTDYDGLELIVDGVWGRRTASAHAKMVYAAARGRGSGIASGSAVTISGTIIARP